MADIARIIEVVEPEAKALGFDLVRVIVFGKSRAAFPMRWTRWKKPGKC